MRIFLIIFIFLLFIVHSCSEERTADTLNSKTESINYSKDNSEFDGFIDAYINSFPESDTLAKEELSLARDLILKQIRPADSIIFIIKNKGNILFKSCLEGTQYQIEYYFREDRTFDVLKTGILFQCDHYYGTYHSLFNHIYLKYDSEETHFSKFLNVTDSLLIPIDNKDSTWHNYHFFIGDCLDRN
jgi:hypothetical protein